MKCLSLSSEGKWQRMSLRIVITTTLNDNLFHAKLLPLVRSRPDIEVVVVTDRQGPEYERIHWVWPQGAVRWLGRLGGRLLLLLREVLNRRTSVVMAYNVLPHGLFVVLVAGLRRRPIFLHFISGIAEVEFAHQPAISGNRWVQRSRNPRQLERIAQWIAHRAKRLFVPGTNTTRRLIALGYDPKRIVCLHSTIDLDRFSPNFDERNVDVLVAAQLSERKRPLFTLEVFRSILLQRPQTRFCWLGDGPLHDQFSGALERLNLKGSVDWTVTNDVAPFYRRARVFLLCSIREGLSLACMEAMACGAVPVTTDCGDMADVVKNHVTGSLLPVQAPPEAFAREALDLLDDNETWLSRSRASIEIIKSEHSFSNAAAKWQDVLSVLEDEKRDAMKVHNR